MKNVFFLFCESIKTGWNSWMFLFSSVVVYHLNSFDARAGTVGFRRKARKVSKIECIEHSTFNVITDLMIKYPNFFLHFRFDAGKVSLHPKRRFGHFRNMHMILRSRMLTPKGRISDLLLTMKIKLITRL